LVALGLNQMRADRELACDALALSALHSDETTAYGHTILRQAERLIAARWRPMLAGLSEDRARTKQRIVMISRFRREAYRLPPIVVLLVILLAGTGLTDALPLDRPPVYAPARDIPTTHQDKHANILRVHIRSFETGKYLVVDGNEVTCDTTAPGEAGLWEARYEKDFGNDRDRIVYFYSVAARRYLTWNGNRNGNNVTVNGREPNESARWAVWNMGGAGARIVPYPFAHFYLRVVGQGLVKVRYGTDPGMFWDVLPLWRVKTSDDSESGTRWKREHVPGPDWQGTWPNWRPARQASVSPPGGK
jgi:hypothetical protein